jgi:hypothetical protein
LLTSPDALVRDFFKKLLRNTVQRWIRREPNNQDLERFLNSDTDGDFSAAHSGGGGEAANLFTKFRRSFRSLAKRFHSLSLSLPEKGQPSLTFCVSDSSDRITITEMSRQKTYHNLRMAIQNWHIETLVNTCPSQGKVITNTRLSSFNNAFVNDGKFVSFSGFRFIHRARLNLLSLNASPQNRDMGLDLSCRRCGFEKESLPHVLCHCKPQLGRKITDQHNAIQNRLVRAVRGQRREQSRLFVNQACTVAGRNVRPDLVLINDKTKEVSIVDITCPFENGKDALLAARVRKAEKYKLEADSYAAQGYKVYCGAIVVGALGTWDPENSMALYALRIPTKYSYQMIRFIISETIDFSKNIYWEHILGNKYQSNVQHSAVTAENLL